MAPPTGEQKKYLYVIGWIKSETLSKKEESTTSNAQAEKQSIEYFEKPR